MPATSLPKKSFHLSVVAASRNDNHGGGLITRMQNFVDGFVKQCIRHKLSAELILVEWNPPSDAPSLVDTLKFPEERGPCAIRVITVPAKLHDNLRHSENLPLFQMIAKNVGIRRALGKYVLATNIDIIFSDKIINYLVKKLRPNRLYRADRFDIPQTVPQDVPFNDVLLFCKQHAYRVNTKFGTREIHNRQNDYKLSLQRLESRHYYYKLILQKIRKIFFTNIPRFVYTVNVKKIINLLKLFFKTSYKIILKVFFKILNYNQELHTNACGDFTLLSYNDWYNLRGYPEWEFYSWNLDQVFLFQANRNGIKEIDLPQKMSIYHIDHLSGYKPEDNNKLFNWLDTKKIPYLNTKELCQILHQMDTEKKQGKEITYNDDSWGLAHAHLKEVWIGEHQGSPAK